MKFPMDWAYSLYSSMSGNFGKPNKLYMNFLKSGAANSTIQRTLTPSSFRKTLGIERAGALKKIARSPKTVVLDNVARFGNAIEETSKLLGLKRGMDIEGVAKMSPEQARMKMEEIVTEVRNFSGSPDFARHGNLTKQLNLVFMFLNARVQGTASDFARLAGRTGKKDAVRAWGRLGAAVGLPTMALALVNLQPENVADLEQVPQEERERYWMIPRYDGEGKPLYFKDDEGRKIREYFRIPKREITGLFANFIESSIGYASDNDPDAFGKYAKNFIEQTFPINITGRNMQEKVESVVGSSNPLIKAPVEYAMNRNAFFHSNIVPQRLQSKSEYLQYKPTTPEVYKTIGKAFTGRDAMGRRTGGLSPLKLEQLVNSVTGGGLNQFTVGKAEPGRPAYVKYPVLKRFFRSGVVNEDDELDAVRAEKTASEDAKQILRNKAMDFLDAVKSADSQTTRAALVREQIAKDKRVVDRAVELYKDEKEGLSYPEKQIKTLPIKDGSRARFIMQKAASMPRKEVAAWVKNLEEKKLLTNEVRQQIAEIRKIQLARQKKTIQRKPLASMMDAGRRPAGPPAPPIELPTPIYIKAQA